MIIFLLLSLAPRIRASVSLNEFVVLPNQTVEIVNTSSESADISGWYIDDSGGTTYFTIAQNTIIAPNSCIVVTGSFNLNSASADSVRLFDNSYPPTSTSAAIIDQYYYVKSPSPPASFSRIPNGDGMWVEYPQSLGFWNNTTNSCIAPTITPTPLPSSSPTPSATPSLSPSPTIVPIPSINGIHIVEIYPYPDSNEQEWVKIHNTNMFDVDLVDWYIDDSESSGSPPQQFTASIKSDSFYIINLNRSILNNDGDIVRLLDNEQKEKDFFEYSQTTKAKTILVNNNGSTTTIDITVSPTVKLAPIRLDTISARDLSSHTPQRVVTYRPFFISQNNQTTSEVLGIYDYPDNQMTSGNKRTSKILLIIPIVNSALTIVSLFIKMNHA